MKLLTIHEPRFSRRTLSTGVGGLGALAAMPNLPWLSNAEAATQDESVESIVIDLEGELESIHPSLAYSARDWSVVHSIYDSILFIDAGGEIVPLAAETFETSDAATFNVTMKPDMQFHDGTLVTADVLRGSWEFLMNSGSQVAGIFQVVKEIEVIGELDAKILCDSPSPWLPAQIATWLMLVPPGYTAEQALSSPVGTGPYSLASYAAGENVELTRNPNYHLGDVKGEAIAETATFRIVPDAATRVADIATGTANIVTNIPQDFITEVEMQGAMVLEEPVVGSQWVRIATDVQPFEDARVRRALNHAVDSVTIAETLMGGVRPLGSIFPDERAPGHLDSIGPYAYDPDRARALLEEAGVDQGLEVSMEITQAARVDVAEAIASYLEAVGFVIDVVISDQATFNEGWSDPEKPALRMATWSPLYEPHTLLNLVFASDGFLSRYSSDPVDSLIAQAAVEANPEARREIFESINRAMHDDAPVIFLWSLTAIYGVDEIGKRWSPQGNQEIVPTAIVDD